MATRRDDLIARDLGAETIVYDRRTHRAHCLGRTAAAVWRAWDGRSGPGETACRAGQALGEPVDEASVRLVLRRLQRAGLIDRPAGASESGRETGWTLGRRAALRGVAATAGLAVLSVAVRSPAQVAATCLRNGETCSRSSQCCNSCCRERGGGGGPPHCTGGGGPGCLVP